MPETATAPATAAPADLWLTRVVECVRAAWGEQAFQVRGADRMAGVEALVQQRCGFDVHVRAVADRIVAVVPHLTTRDELTDIEYGAFLLEPLHRELSFLSAASRTILAHRLIAAYAMQPVPETARC